jgi:hypothetical protein
LRLPVAGPALSERHFGSISGAFEAPRHVI